MLYNMLKKIYVCLNTKIIGNPENKKMPIKKQKKYLNTFHNPKDEYERSYYKYKCFCKSIYYKRNWLLFVYNLGALCIYPFVYVYLVKKGRGKRRVNYFVDAVVENVPRLPNYDVIPSEIKEKYKEIHEITDVNYQDAYLSSVSLKICKELRKRYFWSYYFRLITTFKLAQFNQYIQDYNPKAIVFYSCEREFSGPLQTLLCAEEGVNYESFMHGDYLYDIAFAFQKYSLYYTWDRLYNNMFDSLRCASQMIIYKPEKLKGTAKLNKEGDCSYFATYYFSDETRESVEIIYNIFRKFTELGLRCKVRPHPRFSNLDFIQKIFKDIEVENYLEYNLDDSISDTLYIIGLNTTVLSQAYFSGKKVVIDNISMKNNFRDLKEKSYIMINRPHILLSNLINSIEMEDYTKKNYKCVIKF